MFLILLFNIDSVVISVVSRGVGEIKTTLANAPVRASSETQPWHGNTLEQTNI